MKRLALACALVAAGVAACGASSSSSTRTIAVDYRTDAFAGAFTGYFPRAFAVRPGMTVNFHQTWSGEPHSVTMGTVIDPAVKPILTLIRGIQAGTMHDSGEVPPGFDDNFFFNRLPTFFEHEGNGLEAAAARPCYAPTLEDVPVDHSACAPKFQQPKPFTGRLAYYSSGFIPFEGPRGNTFSMQIAKDAKPGTYFFYCNVHGPLMSGELTVSKTAKVESQVSLNRRGHAEAQRIVDKLLPVYRRELAGKGRFEGNLAGSDHSTVDVQGGVNEFTPRVINAKVGEKVTWTFLEDHSISFNVPRYAPLFTYDKHGNLVGNHGLDKAKGGWPGPPPGHDNEEADGLPAPPLHLDAGTFDGTGGVHSSGTGFNTGDTYSVTFTRPGTYPYACLIHPGMIGKVIVK